MPSQPPNQTPQTSEPMAIIMAKWPVAGAVKTRLISPDITAIQAAEIARAFLLCITFRLSLAFQGRVVLAVSPDQACESFEDLLADPHHTTPELNEQPLFQRIIPQGAGDLGARIDNAWQQVCCDAGLWSAASVRNHRTPASPTESSHSALQPVAFFGIDSPDIPHSTLQNLQQHLANLSTTFEIAAGPVPDGGYWTLAACRYHPEVLQNIAWGGADVFAATASRAAKAQLNFLALPNWYDVDDPGDLALLRARLLKTTDLALQELARRINEILN